MGTFQALSGCAKRLTALVRARTDSEEEELERRRRDFHAALIGAADSRCLLDMSAQLYAQTERYRRPILIAGTQGKPSAGIFTPSTKAIMKAALKRDAARAVELLDTHYPENRRGHRRNFHRGKRLNALRSPIQSHKMPAAALHAREDGR